MDKQLDRILEEWSLESPYPMPGDVGTRRYFRVNRTSTGNKAGDKAILVLYPDSSPSIDDAFLDFISVHEYVNLILHVPEIYRHSAECRAMLLEDVGDNSLEAHLSQFPQEELNWAEKVSCELIDWIGPLTEAAPKDSTFTRRSFDSTKFDFEWSYCKEHFFNGLLQKPPPLWLDRMMVQIHEYLIPRAKYLAHRDFHVRNLMVFGTRLVTIDFQDARLGPATYDLASILFDGYWNWSDEAKQALLSRVKSALEADDNDFWAELNSTALQRNFKALGTFAFQLLHKGKTIYAPAIPRTLRHIRSHFERLSHGEGVIQTEHWLRIWDATLAWP